MSERKTVVVTGGTTRLGRAIAEGLRADGWRVVTTSHRADAGADVVADLAEPMGAAKLYAAVLKLLGGRPPEALVNNAALYRGEDAAVMSVGLEAPKKLTMLMAGRETGRGAVVNVLDAELVGVTDAAATGYRAAKIGLADWTRKAAQLFAETLTVNGVAPGPVLAPVGVRERAGETPLGRPTPADLARAVAFLLAAPSTSGCIVPVDGGRTLFD